MWLFFLLFFFFFNDTATTEIYTLSLHDALPIYRASAPAHLLLVHPRIEACRRDPALAGQAHRQQDADVDRDARLVLVAIALPQHLRVAGQSAAVVASERVADARVGGPAVKIRLGAARRGGGAVERLDTAAERGAFV